MGEVFRRQRLHRHAANAMEQALPDDPAPLFAAPDYAALRHMKNVALVHNYLGDKKVPSDVRIAVEALKGKDPMAAVLKIYVDANPDGRRVQDACRRVRVHAVLAGIASE